MLLHGSANGAYSWNPVQNALAKVLPEGVRVFAPDMLGYGRSPPASPSYTMEEEVAHLMRLVDQESLGPLHLVAHSLGCMFALHLRHALDTPQRRVVCMTLLDPVLVSVLRETGETEAYAEMEKIYEQAMVGQTDELAIAKQFVEHWGGPHAWSSIGDKARGLITSLVPKIRLEIAVARHDITPLAWFAKDAPKSQVLVGEHTRMAPRRGATQLARALGTPLREVPGASHMLPLTHPGQVARAIASIPLRADF